MATLDELFSPIEAENLARARAELAAEKVKWGAMTPEQQAAHIAAVEAKYANITDGDDEPCDTCGLPADDPDCECGYDSTDADGEIDL